MQCVVTKYSNKEVYLHVIKESKLYWITKEFPKLNIRGDTSNDRKLGIKRWSKSTTAVKTLDKATAETQANVFIGE